MVGFWLVPTLAQHLRGWDERRQAITQAAGRVHP
jgi:hypothetical protein